jgi:catechol 2,3-dioxygenase-like lactoylglutathione lyase family enzyme
MRLSYVTLFVADLPACLTFYRDRLGLPVLHESPRFVQLGAGGTALGLHATDDPARLSRGVNLHFDVEDVDAAVRELQARGVVFHGEPRQEPWGARVARTQDPAGNEVELVTWARGD